MLPFYRWSIWIQLILGGFVQLLHFFTVPETRTTIMMNRIAKKRREESNGSANIWGPDELVPFKDRFSVKEILITWFRPFKMFVTEPIVLVLSLLSGFSDALIFMFIQSFALVYAQWNFSTVAIGLTFIPIGLGYVLAWLAFIPAIKRNIKEREAKPNDERAQYESRLWFLLYTAPCLPIGLIGFAWTIQGPPLHWVGSMVFAGIVGIANYSIYMATIDYMICACGFLPPFFFSLPFFFPSFPQALLLVLTWKFIKTVPIPPRPPAATVGPETSSPAFSPSLRPHSSRISGRPPERISNTPPPFSSVSLSFLSSQST